MSRREAHSAGRLVALLLVAAAAAPGVARAEGSGDVKVGYFVEPAPKTSAHADQTVQVIRPQAAVRVDLGAPFSIDVGYDADIVSGATPRSYAKIDALSSATQFSDIRHAFHGNLELRTGRVTLDAGYSYAFENDYRSHVVSGGARVDLARKNTTFAINYSHNFDSVCDADNRGLPPLERRPLSDSKQCFTAAAGIDTQALAIDSYQASWTQIVTRTLLFQLTAGLEVLDGFQSNPYRRVRLFGGAAEPQEAEPTLRQRVSIQGRLKWALPPLHAALGFSGRGYWDTWGIKSATAELEADKYLGDHLLVRLRGRFYQQTRAVFYRDAGEQASYESVGPVGQYFTGDRELAPIRDWLLGLKVSYLKSAGDTRVAKLFTDVDVNLKIDAIKYDKLTPDPPNEPRFSGLGNIVSALVAQVGVSVRF